MTKEQKLQFIDIISSIFSFENHNIYLVDMSNMNAHQTYQLRKNCFTSQIKVLMVKNTLLKAVIKKYKKKWYNFLQVIKGNTFIMISSTENAPAKIIKDYNKSNKILLLKAAYVSEIFYIGNDKLEKLVNIKSKEELIIEIILTLQSPFINIITAIQIPVYKTMECLQKKY